MEKRVELSLLMDFYGPLLTEKRRDVMRLYCDEDMGLQEIADRLEISRQGVYDNLSRAETLLRNMEEKTGCVRRDLQSRKALREITAAAKRLEAHPDTDVKALAQRILTAAQGLEE